MKNTQKYFYAFVGQNATIGTPNQFSGNYSYVGELVAFSTRQKRDHFVNEYYDQNGSCFCVKTNKHSAKSEFCAGMSRYLYDQYLLEVDQNVDESYNSYFNL